MQRRTDPATGRSIDALMFCTNYFFDLHTTTSRWSRPLLTPIRHNSPGFYILSMFSCCSPCQKIDSQVSTVNWVNPPPVSMSFTPSSCHASLVQGWRCRSDNPLRLYIHPSVKILSFRLPNTSVNILRAHLPLHIRSHTPLRPRSYMLTFIFTV